MIEIRIHRRGGQGGVTLAKILATSRFLAGQSVQAFESVRTYEGRPEELVPTPAARPRPVPRASTFLDGGGRRSHRRLPSGSFRVSGDGLRGGR
jgi:hypothetical protein